MKWFELFKALFGTSLGQTDVVVWENELRPLKIDNDGLCDVLRYIQPKEPRPRADKGNATSKYTLADLKLWIYIYHQNNKKEAGLAINTHFVGCCKHHIRRLVDEGRTYDAACLAKDPVSIPDCWNDIIYAGGNRMYTPEEQSLVFEFCNKIGLNITIEYEREHERVTGEKSATHYIEEKDKEFEFLK